MSQLLLKVFDPEDPGDKPSPAWPLSRLFRERFLPRVLEPKRLRPKTLKHYFEAFSKWKEATMDPPIAEAERGAGGQKLAEEFAATLSKPYRRGLGGKLRILSEFTQQRHLDKIALMFRYARKLKLIRRPPRFPQLDPEQDEPKLPYTIADARAIFQARLLGAWPPERKRKTNAPRPALPPFDAYFGAYFAVAYFTGIRDGDIRSLVWQHVRAPDGQRPWRIVGKRAGKTRKKIRKSLHPDAVTMLLALKAVSPDSSPTAPIFPRAFDDRMFAKVHARVCRLAGLPEDRIQSPHAWRRTHVVERNKTGHEERREEARQALDHSSARTTEEHYADLLPVSLRLMARLVVE